METFFKFKIKILNALTSKIVYKFECDNCNPVYIGKSSRHFSTRIKDISFLTGLKLS